MASLPARIGASLRLRLAILGAVALLVIGTTGALAIAVFNQNGPFTGCLSSLGVVYNVAQAATPLHSCFRGDKVLTFSNAQGPQGIPGPNGAPGLNGTNGTNGTNGAPGLNGTNGTNGTNGAPGTPGISTVTFAFCCGSSPVNSNGEFVEVASKNLPAGGWAIVATANLEVFGPFAGDPIVRDTNCELRNGSGFIGAATDRRVIPTSGTVKVSLSMNGGAQFSSGGGEVSLWCQSQSVPFSVSYAQMMIMQVGGFF